MCHDKNISYNGKDLRVIVIDDTYSAMGYKGGSPRLAARVTEEFELETTPKFVKWDAQLIALNERNGSQAKPKAAKKVTRALYPETHSVNRPDPDGAKKGVVYRAGLKTKHYSLARGEVDGKAFYIVCVNGDVIKCAGPCSDDDVRKLVSIAEVKLGLGYTVSDDYSIVHESADEMMELHARALSDVAKVFAEAARNSKEAAVTSTMIIGSGNVFEDMHFSANTISLLMRDVLSGYAPELASVRFYHGDLEIVPYPEDTPDSKQLDEKILANRERAETDMRRMTERLRAEKLSGGVGATVDKVIMSIGGLPFVALNTTDIEALHIDGWSIITPFDLEHVFAIENEIDMVIVNMTNGIPDNWQFACGLSRHGVSVAGMFLVDGKHILQRML